MYEFEHLSGEMTVTDRGTPKMFRDGGDKHRKGGPCAQKIPGEHFQGRNRQFIPRFGSFRLSSVKDQQT